MECPRCKAEVSPEDEFCPQCDHFLRASDETVLIQGESSAGTQIASPTADETIITEGESDPDSAGGWSKPVVEQDVVTTNGTLQTGGTLGNRYEILQLLGKGGMGAVYKARDTELDRMVAVKVIKPELAQDPEILQRFKQEIILSSQVTHRNVIRIFDLGQAEGIKFISMEFVEGKDLHGILKEKGPLPVEEAVEIMEQVCFALEEAHEAGVVHRDLKPHNIMVGPDDRVVVMDFGIARSVQVTGMTQTGSVLGTPDYMSPEQVMGRPADARSDIFALGVIFFELLTGEVPYDGESPMASMYMRTQERARSVREENPEVPGFIGDVIARCLEIQPQKRFQSARELVHDLEIWRGGTPGTMALTMRHLRAIPRKSRKKPLLVGLGAVVAIALIIAGALSLQRAGPEALEEVVVAPEDVTSLAILPFANTSGDETTAWLSTGLPDMLLTDVGQSAYLRAVSSDRLHQILGDLGLLGTADLDAADRRQIAEYANADKLIWGQYVKLADQIRIDATVEDVAQQVRTPVKVEADNEGELLEAVSRLAGLVRDNLELSSDRVAELEGQAQRPSSDSVVAVRHYLQGLELIRQGNNLGALTQFEASVAEDPEFALAHSKLAVASLLTGRGEDAEQSSRRALELSEDLPPQERNLILANDAQISGDLEIGIEAYQNLLQYRPNDPDLHYDLGLLYESEGLFDQAQEHYARTLELDPQNLGALLASGGALALQGEAESALAPLDQALTLAVQVGNEEAEANALHSLGIAFTDLDRLDDATVNFERSLEIKRRLDDPRGISSSLNQLAEIHSWLGEYDQAREKYDEALDISRSIGDEHSVGMVLMNIGNIERDRGNYEEALRFARQALRIQNNLGDEPFQGVSLNNIGAIYYLQGKYDDALVYYQQALEIRQRLDRPTETADTLHNLGETSATMGRFDEALDYYLQALELRRGAEDSEGAALESYYMGKVFAAQGRYRAALDSVSEATDALRQLDESSSWFAETLAWNGHLLSLLGLGLDARPMVEEALSLAEDWENPWLLTQVLNIEGDRLFYLGDFVAARAAFERAQTVATESGDPLWELTSQVNLAKTDIMAGRSAQASRPLEDAIGQAEALGLGVLAREAAIHLGIALISSGDSDRGREVLTASLDEAEKLVSPDLRARGRFLLAGSLLAAGDETAANEQVEKASSLVAEMLREAGGDSMLERSDLAPFRDASDPGLPS